MTPRPSHTDFWACCKCPIGFRAAAIPFHILRDKMGWRLTQRAKLLCPDCVAAFPTLLEDPPPATLLENRTLSARLLGPR